MTREQNLFAAVREFCDTFTDEEFQRAMRAAGYSASEVSLHVAKFVLLRLSAGAYEGKATS